MLKLTAVPNVYKFAIVIISILFFTSCQKDITDINDEANGIADMVLQMYSMMN